VKDPFLASTLPAFSPTSTTVDLQLKDKVAIVTGGSRGLGRAICKALADEGAKIAINYVRDQAAGEELLDSLRSTCGVDAIAVRCDVANSGDVKRLFQRTEEVLGPPDVLVNNAGIWPTSYVRDTTEEEFRRVLDVNLTGAFLTCREAVRSWLDSERQGRIVNVTSPAAFIGATTGHAHYAASKAGLVSFSVSLAREVAAAGIHVNLVAPGMTRTDMARDALAADEEKYLARIPLRRIAEPEEIADVVTFLASHRARYMTGATVDVTGGLLMR
jgi:3-oxoacyl-[acyl-carrier protein] reductase